MNKKRISLDDCRRTSSRFAEALAERAEPTYVFDALTHACQKRGLALKSANPVEIEPDELAWLKTAYEAGASAVTELKNLIEAAESAARKKETQKLQLSNIKRKHERRKAENPGIFKSSS